MEELGQFLLKRLKKVGFKGEEITKEQRLIFLLTPFLISCNFDYWMGDRSTVGQRTLTP